RSWWRPPSARSRSRARVRGSSCRRPTGCTRRPSIPAGASATSWKVRALASGDLREDEHLAVGGDRLQQRVLVDLAVDRHRHAFGEVALELRVELGELLEELLHGRRRETELGDAPRELREVTDQNYAHSFIVGALKWPPHPPPLVTPRRPRSLRALRTLGGDIGSSVKRMPVAASIALAIAPSGGTIGVSPTPRTPYGCLGFATSTRIASIIGTSEATGIR